MTAILARNPLQTLHMASTNRPNTRRRSAKRDFEEEDAPAPKRPKTEVNGAAAKGGGRANGATKKGAKAATYEEDDDGFQFSRRTTRKSAAKAKAAPEPVPEEPAEPPPSRRKKNPTPVAEPAQAAEPVRKRRSARLSGDSAQAEIQPQPVKPLPKRTKKAAPAERRQPTEEPEERVAHIGAQTPNQNELHVAKKRDEGATKIMLPFADTPVITRNKEMRKGSKNGHRRSSTGLRGRRASSLIDSGLSNVALPHSEVEVREFYKYIEQSLPEPRRMKQLLTWCGSRALPEKPSGAVKDANVIMAARAIQQELIEDFAGKSELSDWFSREDTTPASVVKKPNPQNVKNEAAIQELEEEIRRLEEEKAAWETLKASSIPTTTDPPPIPEPTLSSIDPTLLSPSQAAILTTLAPQPPSSSIPKQDEEAAEPRPPSAAFTFRFTTPAALSSHLSSLASSLEPNIDLLADGVHKIEQFRNTAERAAERVLGAAARTLEERERGVKERMGTEGIGARDVLRGLAAVMQEGRQVQR